MDKLARLVRKTMIEDNRHGRPHDRKQPWNIHGINGASRAEANQSYSSSLPLPWPSSGSQFHHNNHLRPSNGSAAAVTGDGGAGSNSSSNSNRRRRRQKVYANCNDLPGECEAGGQCVLTTARDGGADNDMDNKDNNNKAAAARCQCPIGRGGLLCQKREYPDNNNKHASRR